MCWERTEQAAQRNSSGRRPWSPHMQQTAASAAPNLPSPPMEINGYTHLAIDQSISDGWAELPHEIDSDRSIDRSVGFACFVLGKLPAAGLGRGMNWRMVGALLAVVVLIS